MSGPDGDITFCGRWSDADKVAMREWLEHRQSTGTDPMTKFPDLFAALAAPFAEHEVKVRQAQGGRSLQYITARTAMNRLDQVLGPENWWDEYIPGAQSVMCKLTIRLPDGSTVTKQDAGGYAGMADQGDDDKSGFSDAYKRACAKLGIARYLYRDGVPEFVLDREPSSPPGPARDPAPGRPAPARDPAPRPAAQTAPRGTDNHSNGNGNGSRSYDGPPRTGRAMYAWTKDQEQKHEVGLLKYLNNWGKLQDYPGRMVDWSDDQVALAYQEAIRKLEGHSGTGSTPNQAPGGSIQALRDDLQKQVWMVAQGKNPKAIDSDYYAVLDSLAMDAGGEIINSVSDCEDADLLKRYIEVAKDRLAVGA